MMRMAASGTAPQLHSSNANCPIAREVSEHTMPTKRSDVFVFRAVP
jgi:hypothetical protein